MRQIKKNIPTFLLLLGLILIMHLPFVAQAFHIDDPHFLRMAGQILENFKDPYGYTFNWHGRPEPGYNIMANPPLFGYFLAGIIKLFSESEMPVHCGMILFSIIFAYSAFLLSLRFKIKPLFSVPLLLATPAYMVMSHTAMADIPSLAFYVASIACFIYGYDKQNAWLLLLSGVCAAAAAMLKYIGLLSFATFLLYSFFNRKGITKKTFLAFLGLLPFLIWCRYTAVIYGKPVFYILFNVGGQYALAHKFMPLVKLLALISYFGGAGVFPVILLCILGRRIENQLIFKVSFFISLFIGFFVSLFFRYNIFNFILLTTFLTSGFFYIAIVLKRFYFRNKSVAEEAGSDYSFLTIWFCFLILFNAFFTVASARVILFPLVPAAFLFFKFVQEEKIYFTIISIVFFIGLTVSLADYFYANSYRQFVKDQMPGYAASEKKIWVAGHWGFQYYMEKAGAEPLSDLDTRPIKSDIIIFANSPWPQLIGRDLGKRIKTIKIVDKNCWLPVRTTNIVSNAHFYSYVNYPARIGFLPYSISSLPLERFVTLRVIKDLDVKQ